MSRPVQPTHYDVLGVTRAASPDDIRRAYRQAAREAHPDRHGDASAGRMAAVNEAWRVLGDPGRRRAYDAGLDDRAPGSARSPGAPATGSAAAGGSSAANASSGPPPMPTGDFSRFPWRFFAVIGTFAIGFVVVNAALSDAPEPVPVDNVLFAGECVAVNGVAVTEVRCVAPFDGTVAEVVDFDGACPTGTTAYREPQGRGWACVRPVVVPTP